MQQLPADMMARIRKAVAEVSENHRIEEEMRETTGKRLTIGDTVYTHGSREVRPGTVRKPGTRRASHVRYTKPRWAAK